MTLVGRRATAPREGHRGCKSAFSHLAGSHVELNTAHLQVPPLTLCILRARGHSSEGPTCPHHRVGAELAIPGQKDGRRVSLSPHFHPPSLVRELQEAGSTALGRAGPKLHVQVAWCELLGICAPFSFRRKPLILKGTLTELRNLVTVRPTRQKHRQILPEVGGVHVAPHRGHPTMASDGCSPAILFVPVPALIAETGMIPQLPATRLAHGAGPASLCLALWKRSDQPRSRGLTGPWPTTHTYWLLGSKRDGLGSHEPLTVLLPC